MHELLRNLQSGDLVLDLGCADGSFHAENSPYTVIRIDLERGPAVSANFAQADAARLPFRDHSFNVVISNHSLEHFDNLEHSLQEIGRVVKPDGSLYVAVPDASTISDRLYRWLARGGGHVNAFRSAPELAAKIERATGLKHVATRTLCTGLSCFNRKNRRTRAPRRLLLLGGGTETSLRFYSYLARFSDRLFHTRASVYGWAFYFGRIESPVDTGIASNVCIRCGSGHPSAWLQAHARIRRKFLFFDSYECPGCGTSNLYSGDPHLG
jgi:SAM-dependent methyltransferase